MVRGPWGVDTVSGSANNWVFDLLDHPLQGGSGGVIGAGADVPGKGLDLLLESFHFHHLTFVIEASISADRSHPQGLP